MKNSNVYEEGSVFIVKNGKIEVIDKPKTGFGKTIIHWQNGKATSQEIIYTKKFNK